MRPSGTTYKKLVIVFLWERGKKKNPLFIFTTMHCKENDALFIAITCP